MAIGDELIPMAMVSLLLGRCHTYVISVLSGPTLRVTAAEHISGILWSTCPTGVPNATGKS